MIVYKDLGRSGRFGNCLFQIAGTIGIATKSYQPYAFPKFIIHDMVDRFGSTEDIEVWKHLLYPLPEMDTTLNYSQIGYIWDYREIRLHTGNYDLSPSHFQSIKFFDHCMDRIRIHFTFKDEPPQNDYVAIHYRAGDYIDDPNAYHPRCSKEYYEEAMKHFPEGTKYILFTDDKEDFVRNKCEWGKIWRDVGYSPGRNYLEDFKFMKSCKSFICANSSFSHMAALLGTHPEKKIVMPKRWFGSQANGLNFDSLYPPKAIVI